MIMVIMVMSVTAVCYLRCIIFPNVIVLIDYELELLLYPFCECFLVELHAVYVHVIAMTTITAISMAMITPIAIAILLETLLSVFIVSIARENWYIIMPLVNVIQQTRINKRITWAKNQD